MKKAYLFLGIVLLLWGTNIVIGQDHCWVAPCDPCGGHATSSPFTFDNWAFGGWVEMGVYTNSHGSNSNGPMHVESRRRTDFLMSQLYFFGEREMDARRGFDWGARADLVYGVDRDVMQTVGDQTFDYNWGTNRHGYGMSAYQLYGTLGYRDFSVKAGKFYGLVGWEAATSPDNFFYSHSYCYAIEPATHMGVLATRNLTDRLSVNGGWVTGENSSFKNPHGNKAVLTGFTYALTDDATMYYQFNGGRQGDGETRLNYFVQSLVFEWEMTDRFTYVLQYNLRNDNERKGAGRFSSYGLNNHFLYKLNDRWGAGMRVEWLRENGGADYHLITPTVADFYQVTWGLNWNPRRNVSIRPEVRYDWCKGASPFAKGTRSNQISGGCGIVVSF